MHREAVFPLWTEEFALKEKIPMQSNSNLVFLLDLLDPNFVEAIQQQASTLYHHPEHYQQFEMQNHDQRQVRFFLKRLKHVEVSVSHTSLQTDNCHNLQPEIQSEHGRS